MDILVEGVCRVASVMLMGLERVSLGFIKGLRTQDYKSMDLSTLRAGF